MFFDLEFGSCYVYSPQGACKASVRSRVARALLKSADSAFLMKYAGIAGRQAGDGCLLSRLFAGDPILVPVPGSAPQNIGTPWIAERLCIGLVRQGLGRFIWPGLRRIRTVRKSGTARPAERPSTWVHYSSFSVDTDLGPYSADRILLVDDVVTKGRTLLAAATRLHETFPDAKISAFAFVRTMGLVPDIRRLIDPCIGEIRWSHGDAWRNP